MIFILYLKSDIDIEKFNELPCLGNMQSQIWAVPLSISVSRDERGVVSIPIVAFDILFIGVYYYY